MNKDIEEDPTKVLLKFARYESPEIQSLGFVRPFSNSEVIGLGCTRSYTFEYVEQFKGETLNKNFAYGTCWHSVLEEILKKTKEEDVFPTNSEIIEWLKSNLLTLLNKCMVEYQDLASQYELQELKDSIAGRITLAIEGWMDNWRENIHPRYKVLEVEMMLYGPVHLGSKQFMDTIRIVKEIYPSDKEGYREKHIYRPFYTGEESLSWHIPDDCIRAEVCEIEMPYYKVGKIDALLLHRTENSLWILDHKSTKYPSNYERKTRYNLQLNGYASLLREYVNQGKFDYIKNRGMIYVGGVIWDICSSDIGPSKIPSPLKSGKLSKARKGSPYWLYKRAVEDNGLDFGEYEDHYNELKSSSNFFILKEEHISESEMDRCKVEDYVAAEKISRIRKDLELTDFNEKFDWERRSPRFTICTAFGSCKYSNNCLANAKPNDIYLKRQQKISWICYKK